MFDAVLEEELNANFFIVCCVFLAEIGFNFNFNLLEYFQQMYIFKGATCL